jgi:hypothetical protein
MITSTKRTRLVSSVITGKKICKEVMVINS